MKARILHAAVFLLVFLSAPRSAAAGEFTGVRGWAVLGDNAAAGVTVYAFPDYERGLASVPTSVSTPTPTDGRFALELPPGTYHLVGARTAGSGLADLREGDLFCYFGGNPVRVEPGRATPVGLHLVRVAADPASDISYGISGTVFDEGGRPLSGAVVYLYKSPGEGLKGLPGQFARTRGDGTFQIRLKKGTFFVVVRKRESGEILGPTRVGDHFGFYPRNPVVLAEGERKGIRIDALPRQDPKEKMGGEVAAESGATLRAVAVDPQGKPLPGVRLLAYRTGAMTGFPAFVSAKSAADGILVLSVPEEGTYFLLAREKLGGPADGEWYGKYAGTPDHSVRVTREAAGEPLRIVLERR